MSFIRTIHEIGQGSAAGPSKLRLPPLPAPPARDIALEADAARRDLEERMRRSKGRRASNLRIPALSQPIQTNRPELGVRLG